MATKYVDQVNGNDADAGTKVAPWLTIQKFIEDVGSWGLAAGDTCIVRSNGGSESPGQDMDPAVDGDLTTPITVQGDDGTEWPADLTTLTNTYSVTNGSTAVTASATESELAADDQFKVDSDGRWYDVASVSGTAVTLKMRYRGPTASGEAGTMCEPPPKIDFGAGAYGWKAFRMYWMHERIWITNSSDSYWGAVEVRAASCIWDNCRIEANSGHAPVQMYSGATGLGDGVEFLRCYIGAGSSSYGSFFWRKSGAEVTLDDCYLASYGIVGWTDIADRIHGRLRHVELAGANGQINCKTEEAWLDCINVVFGSASPIANYRGSKYVRIAVQDFDGTKRDSRVFTHLDTADNDPILRRNTGTVRSGGADSSIEVRPSTYLSTEPDWLRLLALEAYLYLPASSKTITVYFNLPAANFTAAPTASELWVELEYLLDATNAGRRVLKSTGTVAADGTWDPLTVTATPSAAGEAIVRVYYCKTKEGGDSNYFYVDPEPTIT